MGVQHRGKVNVEQRTNDLTDLITRMVNLGGPWGPVKTAYIDVVIRPCAKRLVVDFGIDPNDTSDYSALEACLEEQLLSYSFYAPEGSYP